MNAPLSKSSESTNWLHLYRAAILEMDPSKLSQQVAEAENALTQRERELFRRETGFGQCHVLLAYSSENDGMQLSRTHWGDWPCEGCVSTTAGHFNLISRPARS